MAALTFHWVTLLSLTPHDHVDLHCVSHESEYRNFCNNDCRVAIILIVLLKKRISTL
uniref:Uncharacterized protein n=1 Tax=Rhizophora mucronata TaxID=61149 RepID=A0A2P2QZ40_RHIMU